LDDALTLRQRVRRHVNKLIPSVNFTCRACGEFGPIVRRFDETLCDKRVTGWATRNPEEASPPVAEFPIPLPKAFVLIRANDLRLSRVNVLVSLVITRGCAIIRNDKEPR
jgi:hypothetical protein